MEDVGRILLALQELDRQYARTLRERSAASGQERREELAADSARAAQREKEMQDRLHQVKAALKEAELDLGSLEERLSQAEKRLYGGAISNPKELTQLQHRVQEDRAARGKLEDKILKMLDEAERLERGRLEAAAEAKRAAENLDTYQTRLEERAAEEARADELYAGERQALLGQLPEEYRVKYERIQRSHPGSALALIDRGNCGGCHTALAQAELERAARQPGLTTCENCGRLLWPERPGRARA